MKVLVTGVKGQLGYDVVKHCKENSIEVQGIDKDEADITNEAQIKQYIKDYDPDIVIHCAAYTAVDKAETDKDLCYKINVLGTRYIAEACRDIDAVMMYFSTDYVFQGDGESFYKEDDPVHPSSEYGLTKWQGEEEVRKVLSKYFILRISWVYGINGHNFVKTMLKLAETHKELNVVNDQIGSPTYTDDVAKLIIDMFQTDKYGTYHVTNEDICSWYEFACKIFELSNISITVHPVTSDKYPSAAKRPLNSRLDKTKLETAGFHRLPTWEDALERYLKELERQH